MASLWVHFFSLPFAPWNPKSIHIYCFASCSLLYITSWKSLASSNSSALSQRFFLRAEVISPFQCTFSLPSSPHYSDLLCNFQIQTLVPLNNNEFKTITALIKLPLVPLWKSFSNGFYGLWYLMTRTYKFRIAAGYALQYLVTRVYKFRIAAGFSLFVSYLGLIWILKLSCFMTTGQVECMEDVQFCSLLLLTLFFHLKEIANSLLTA